MLNGSACKQLGRPTNNSQSAGSSSLSKSCSVPVAMASNPKEDALIGDKKIHQRCGESNVPNHSSFITLELTNDGYNKSRLGLPLSFMRRNGLNKPGEIGLLGKDGRKLMVTLRQASSTGRMSLGKGWKDFVSANGLQIGESFRLELIWEESTPMFRLSSTGTGKYTSEIPNRVLTLTLKPKDVRDCKLILPTEFMRALGINKLGRITFLGKANTKWWGYRSSRDGPIAIGIGWENFCKANGVKIGDFFTLEFIDEEVDKTPVFRICPKSGD